MSWISGRKRWGTAILALLCLVCQPCRGAADAFAAEPPGVPAPNGAVAVSIPSPVFQLNAASTADDRASASVSSLSDGAKSVLLMDAGTGDVLFEHNADERLPPASVTKIMTILLVVEAIDAGTLKLEDTVQVSERASKMGGSQVYLKAGETMSVSDLLKSVVVASANDAATSLAEQVAGSVESFVERMNERAKELGMTNTVFENPTGLDDATVDHLTTARDISLMSRELLSHKLIFNYTTIWMDSIRNGAFGLTNTNRLIRFYSGANGLKTGSTSRAGFCISATAKRDGMQLIAVIMGASSRDERNEIAKKLLDYGFANYRFYRYEKEDTEPVKVLGGEKETCRLTYDDFAVTLPKAKAVKGVQAELKMADRLTAPIAAGDIVGTMEFSVDGEIIGTADVRAAETVARIGYGGLLKKLLSALAYR